MPQSPPIALVAKNLSTGNPTQLKEDSNGNLRVANGLPTNTNAHYNISAATVVKDTPGQILALNVISTSTVAGGVYDTTATSLTGAANQAAVIPASVGPVTGIFNWVTENGIVVTPGAGQVVAVLYL